MGRTKATKRDMKKIHFLANKEAIINYTLAPIRANRKRLRDRGYEIKVFYGVEPRLLECDVLCLISKPTHSILGDCGPQYQEDGPIVQLLKKARAGCGKVIWMDDSDSTSVTHFELMPYVDLYLKKQVFVDKTLYQAPLYGGRIFSDFYHRAFGIEDETLFDQFYPLDEKDRDKLRVSWNIGLGNMYNAFTWRSLVSRYFPDYFSVDYDVPFIDPAGERPVDMFLRTSANLGRNSVAFHRQETLRQLTDILERRITISGMIGNTVSRPTEASKRHLPEVGGRLPTKVYRDIMVHTKIAPSPFGWGEIGVRDYEAFIFGAVLLKPDMTHMASWPDIFIPGETYVPVKWGFEDLEAQIDDLLANEKERLRIARNGQEAYRQSISREGHEAFCDWFLGQIGERS